MLFMSVVLEDRAPYERVLSYNSVVAEDGSKFSKTGFMIKFDEAAEKIGADTIRYMYAGAPVANDVRFGFNLGDEARRKLLSFWNIYTFFNTYAELDKPNFNGYTPDISKMTLTDKWLNVRTNQFIEKATEYMDSYTTPALIKEFEIFVDDISNWYIRSNRRRFWKTGDNEDKMLAYWTLFNALNTLIKVMAPIIPFMTEHIWQNLTRKVLPESEISVHLADWPVPDSRFTDDGIIARTALARDVIASALRLRNEKQLKVRQPLQTLFICLPEEKAANIRQFEKNILDELNIREIKYLTDKSVLEDSFLQVNFKAAGAVFKQDVNKFKTALENLSADVMSQLVEKVKNGESTRLDGFDFDIAPDLYVLKEKTKEGIVSVEFDEDGVLALDTVLTDELLKDGAVRDVIRQCQLIRKEAGYVVDQRVTMSVSSDDEFVINALKEKEDYLLSELLADSIVFNGAIDGSDLTKDIDYNDSKIVLQVKKA